MDILKTATDWAKAEVFSIAFFILFGIGFVAAGIGFWQLGKTDLARAYIIPTLVAGALLLIIGFGLFLPISQESHNLKKPTIVMPRLSWNQKLLEPKAP
jgi:hypothetical protein